MHKRYKYARIRAIMSKIASDDDENPAHCNLAQKPNQGTVPEVTSVRSNVHEYDLREVIQRSYCDGSDDEVNEDFSPDISEYLPSPKTQKAVRRRSESSSSFEEDTTYCVDEIKTPSTNSVVSFILNQTDFIASPSVVYKNCTFTDKTTNHGDDTSCSTPTTSVSEHTLNHKKSRRMIQYHSFSGDEEKDINAPSSSANAIYAQNYDKEEEYNLNYIVSQTNHVDPFNLDETLTPVNIDCDSTLTDVTLVADEQHNKTENYQTTTNHSNSAPGIAGVDNQSSDKESHPVDDSFLANQLPQPDTTDGVSDMREPILDNEVTQKKLTRKRIRNESERLDQKNKRLKNLGEAYVGCKSKKKFDKKTIKPVCKCQKKCGERFTEEQREAIFKDYYKLGDHERQWQYIASHTIAEDVKRITLNRKCNRTQTVKYFFELQTERVQVCKTFFINTLSISHQTVYTALEKVKSNEGTIDKRGQHDNRPRKMSIETEENIIAHIQLFPTVESHYVRKDSSRQYLSEDLNISKMYRLYQKWYQEGSYEFPMASKRQYETIFNTKFNYSFFRPKKDQCGICSLYRQADPERQETLQEKYNQHQKNKERVREIKAKEKESVNPTDTTIAIFDLEKVLSIPQSQVGIFHYKRKYPIYNFTVFDATRKRGYCYVWHYQIAKRGAIEIGSCLWQFLLNEHEKGIKNISFYSDGCGGQNKNRFIFALYILAARKFQMNITHRFFETGHGQSEGDSMHSTIERELKHKVVYTPDQMYTIIINAKVTGEKYIVKEMSQNDFYDIKELITNKNWVKDVAGHKISWSKIMEVNVTHEQPHLLRYKYDFDEEYSQMDTQLQKKLPARRKRGACQTASNTPNSAPEHRWKAAYTDRLPLPKALHGDLMSLCKSEAIPYHYHGFYESLTFIERTETHLQDDDDVEE